MYFNRSIDIIDSIAITHRIKRSRYRFTLDDLELKIETSEKSWKSIMQKCAEDNYLPVKIDQPRIPANRTNLWSGHIRSYHIVNYTGKIFTDLHFNIHYSTFNTISDSTHYMLI